MRGIPGDPAYPGYRGANMLFQVRPPATTVTATVQGNLSFSPGYDATYGRALAAQSILQYINTRAVGEAVRYARIIDIAMNSPGATNFVVTNPATAVDVAPTSETGVVRATAVSIA